MNTRCLTPLLSCLAALTLGAATEAQTAPIPPADPPPAVAPAVGSEQADRAMFNRLVRQLRRVDRDTAKVMKQAMTEAREHNGDASLETKARILSLRDERDRLLSRLLVLSMRHGWELPDLDQSTAPAATGRQEAVNSVFGSVDTLVRRQFTNEARRLAGTVRLPVVSLESMSR